MKNIFKLFALTLIAFAGFTACDQANEKDLYDTSLPPAYSMVQGVRVAELVPADNGILNIPVTRTDVSSAGTVQVKMAEANATTLALFSLVSTEVQFAAGENQANAQVKFDLSKLSNSGSYAFAIALPDSSYMSKGGYVKTSVTASKKLTFVLCENEGVVSITSPFTIPGEPAQFSRAVEDPNTYKLVDFFAKELLFSINPTAGTVSMPRQSLGEDNNGDGAEDGIQGNGTYANGVCNFSYAASTTCVYIGNNAAGTNAYRLEMKFTLPKGSY